MGKTIVVSSDSPEVTMQIGEAVGRCLSAGWTVALRGELGAGKTWLTKGIAKGIGIDGNIEVTSPTFAIINEYPGVIPLLHMDAYRIGTIDDLLELGYPEGDSKSVWVIEWAEKIRDALPEATLSIEIEHRTAETRELRLSGEAALIDAICALLKRYGHSGVRVRELTNSPCMLNPEFKMPE